MELSDFVVQKQWGMFTSKGNDGMRRMGFGLVNRMARAKTYSDKINALEVYFKAYQRKGTGKATKEAMDTDVRDIVIRFAWEVCRIVGVDPEVVQEIYDNSSC